MKHLHITLAVISVGLFTLRFFWLLMNSGQLQKKWVKITPHIIDTLLLVLGVVMAIKLGINPMEYAWLLEKILAVFAYVFTAYYTLKLARNNIMRVLGYLGALGWVMLIVRLAISKQALVF